MNVIDVDYPGSLRVVKWKGTTHRPIMQRFTPSSEFIDEFKKQMKLRRIPINWYKYIYEDRQYITWSTSLLTWGVRSIQIKYKITKVGRYEMGT